MTCDGFLLVSIGSERERERAREKEEKNSFQCSIPQYIIFGIDI